MNAHRSSSLKDKFKKNTSKVSAVCLGVYPRSVIKIKSSHFKRLATRVLLN